MSMKTCSRVSAGHALSARLDLGISQGKRNLASITIMLVARDSDPVAHALRASCVPDAIPASASYATPRKWLKAQPDI